MSAPYSQNILSRNHRAEKLGSKCKKTRRTQPFISYFERVNAASDARQALPHRRRNERLSKRTPLPQPTHPIACLSLLSRNPKLPRVPTRDSSRTTMKRPARLRRHHHRNAWRPTESGRLGGCGFSPSSQVALVGLGQLYI